MNKSTPDTYYKLFKAAATMPIKVPDSRSSAFTPTPIHRDHKLASYASDCPLSYTKSTKSKSSRDQKASCSFFNCIGKHLRCHLLQHHTHDQQSQQHQQQQKHMQHAYTYNSQDDLRSSSTDSFSLSYERGSQIGFHLTGSSIDLTSSAADELREQQQQHYAKYQKHREPNSQHASHNTLSSSVHSGSLVYSPAFCSFDVDCLVDIYNGDDEEDDVGVTSLKVYQQHQHHASDANVAHSSCSSGHNSDCTNSSSDEAEDADACSLEDGECCKQQKEKKLQLQQQQRKSKKHEVQHNQRRQHEQRHQHQQQHIEQTQHNTTTTHKRLHLSRLSIASSVTRMLNHLARSTSMRSLSCSSTPLRCFKDTKPKEAGDVAAHLTSGRSKHDKTKKHSLPNTLTLSSSSSSSDSRSSSSGNNSSRSGSGSSGSGSGCNSAKSISSGSTSNKKKDKKQQSILRPPVHYVYTKGMSGLYSRVPRYTVCSPYVMH